MAITENLHQRLDRIVGQNRRNFAYATEANRALTSKKVAKRAAKVLGDEGASKVAKSIAASALRQAKKRHARTAKASGKAKKKAAKRK